MTYAEGATVSTEPKRFPPEKLGWVAGVIDLRGKILRKKNRQRATPQIVIMVESKNKLIIDTLAAMTGTKPELKAAQHMPEWMRKNCKEHCPEKHVHVGDPEVWRMPPTARWTATGAAVAIIVHTLLPHLMSKENWMTILLESTANTPLFGRGSGATISTIKRLYQLGWEVPPQFERVLSIESEADLDEADDIVS